MLSVDSQRGSVTFFYTYRIIRNLNPIKYLIDARQTARSFHVILLFHPYNSHVTWLLLIFSFV